MFKLSPEASLDGSITVENKFIVEYMPYADGDYVKVYLYGLSLAARKESADDNIERLARRLDLDRAVVDAALDYWCDLGLISRLGDEISYMSLRTARPKIKKYDVDKYREFNRLVQMYIAARQIPPNEYNEYYALMEKLGLEWQAMVLIVKYCVDLKGDNVSCPYVLAVARNLASDGYRTSEEVENRLEEYGVYYNDLCAVTAAMGGKRPDHEAVKLYKKWKMNYKFDRDVIIRVAETVKKGGIAALDGKLENYHDLGLSTFDAIERYETERHETYKLAKSINKALGVYYENVDPEIAAYIKPWLEIGFDRDALISLADYCMRAGLKTLSDLDAVVRDCFSDGAISSADISARIDREHRYDKQIAEVMAALALQGAVKTAYRAFYANWVEKWGFDKSVILYAASLSVGKPFSYVNAVLSAWHADGIVDVESAKARGTKKPDSTPNADPANPVHERITADELNALFNHVGDNNK